METSCVCRKTFRFIHPPSRALAHSHTGSSLSGRIMTGTSPCFDYLAHNPAAAATVADAARRLRNSPRHRSQQSVAKVPHAGDHGTLALSCVAARHAAGILTFLLPAA